MNKFIRCAIALLALAALSPALATLPGTDTRTDLVAGGGTDFTFTFKVYEAASVEVFLNGVKQALGFTVSLNANQDTTPGGTVTFLAPPASGTAVRIQRTVALTQLLDLNPSSYPAKSIAKAFDREAMRAQQIQRQVEDLAAGTLPATTDASALTVGSNGSTTLRPLGERFAEVVNVKDFGAKGDGSTDDTAAFTAAVAACGGSKPGVLYVPSGTYRTDTIRLLSWCALVGSGWLSTTIRPVNDNNDLVFLDRASGSTYGYQNAIRGLHLWGHSTGTGRGIYGSGDVPSAVGPSGLRMDDVYVDGFGGDGIYFTAVWDAEFHFVQSSNNLGHQFRIIYAIGAVTLRHCYARASPTVGKAGFRVERGNITLDSCNGLDSGTHWGVFGSETADGDSLGDAPAYVIVRNSNVEDFKVDGITLKRNGRLQIDGTSFNAPALVSTTGSVGIGSTALTLADPTGIFTGQWVTIAGVARTKQIVALAGTAATLSSASDATVVGASVQNATRALVNHNFNNNTPIIYGVTNAVSSKGSLWVEGLPYHSYTPSGMVKFGVQDFTNAWNYNANTSSQGLPALRSADSATGLQIVNGVVIGTNATGTGIIRNVYTGTASWSPNLATSTVASTTVPVTNAAVGMVALPSFSVAAPAGLTAYADPTSAGTVTVTVRNDSGSTWNPGAITVKVRVWE